MSSLDNLYLLPDECYYARFLVNVDVRDHWQLVQAIGGTPSLVRFACEDRDDRLPIGIDRPPDSSGYNRGCFRSATKD